MNTSNEREDRRSQPIQDFTFYPSNVSVFKELVGRIGVRDQKSYSKLINLYVEYEHIK